LDLNNLNIDLKTLLRYEEDGWIVKQSHPSLPLYIWNYSRTCQYESNWDEVTMNCRALVTDFDGNIIARGFKKFFNLEEHKDNEIPNESFDVYEKLDGSLILAFQYNNNWVISSKGSFNSEQAIAAEKLFYELGYHEVFDNEGYTHVFEYISDSNRIVVKYDKNRLVLLAMIEAKTGNELNIDVIASNFFQKEMGFIDVVKKYDGISDYRKLRELFSGDNREGFVVKFKSGFRVKLKYEEYVRLHRIITNVTSYDIWETLKEGNDIEDLLQNVPDEFDSWVRNLINELNIKYNVIYNEYYNIFDSIKNKLNIHSLDKKAFAEEALKYNYSSILFNLNTGKSIDKVIWTIIKPKFEKPFKSIINE
jgi:RNA ligase